MMAAICASGAPSFAAQKARRAREGAASGPSFISTAALRMIATSICRSVALPAGVKGNTSAS